MLPLLFCHEVPLIQRHIIYCEVKLAVKLTQFVVPVSRFTANNSSSNLSLWWQSFIFNVDKLKRGYYTKEPGLSFLIELVALHKVNICIFNHLVRLSIDWWVGVRVIAQQL